MVCLPSNALAEDEICFDKPTAAKIATTIKSCQETEDRIGDIIEKYAIEAEAQKQVIDNINEQLSVQEDQYKDCTARGDEYRQNWEKASEALVDCQKSKPSRWTWFSMGAGGGLVVALLLIAL